MDGKYRWGGPPCLPPPRKIKARRAGGALYVGEIFGADRNLNTLTVLNIIGVDGLNLYYNPFLHGNNYLQGLTYALNDAGTGNLKPPPSPPASSSWAWASWAGGAARPDPPFPATLAAGPTPGPAFCHFIFSPAPVSASSLASAASFLL